MANYFLCFVGQRIVLPVIISSCIYLRPTGFALLYFILLLWLPCVPVATKRTLLGSTGIYFKALVAISALVTSAQLIFQIVLTAMPPYGHTLTNCTFPESVLRQIGLVALNTTQIKDCFRWVLPEVIMLIASILMYIVQKKLTTKNKPAPVTPTDAMSETMSASDIEAAKQKRRFDKKFAYLTSIGKYIALGVLCLAGIMKPSIPNAMYYIVFLGFGTWWACYKKLGRVFGIILRCVALLVALHLTALLLYQLQYLQEMLPQDSPMARYFGLTPIVIVDCDDPRVFKANSEYYTDQLNLVALLCLYYMCIYESKMLLRPAYSINAESALSRHMKNRISHKFPGGKRKSQTSDHWKNATRKIRVYVRAEGRTQPSENTPLMRTVTPERSRHDSVIKEESDQTIIEHIGYGIINIFQIIIKSSYIASNLCMMAWSIMYHSWLAFVFLLWANLVWIIPKQRRTMLLTSPVLVCYAEFLLLVQYIYAMNFTNDELPETIGNFDLNQIGFGRPVKEDVYPLLIKSVFLAMFWVTLRQMMKERDIKRQSSALADMVAPLQITVGTAAADMKQPEIKQSAFMIKMGKFLHSFMTKCWLWVVAISLFVSGLTGDRMTVFRIIYMGLFLIFILTFQISWRAWRKMMYWFWLVVIVYSMLILILVYTYQFEDFKNYWEQYLLIPPDLQLDIGLETYKTRELFFKLITPTIFVIISVIQLHYYHDDFLAITDVTVFNDLPPTEVKTEERSTPGVATTYKRSESLIEAVKSSSIILKLQNWILEKYSDFTDKIWLILELHLLKLTMFAIMLMCIFDVCAMHFFFVCMICLVMPFGNRYQVIVVRVISMFLCILFIMKMIYQIEYIEHSKHLVTCPGWKNTSFNTASWLGFNKASATVPLAEIFMGYIIILIIITVNAGVSFHQSYRRLSLGKVDKRPYVMFPTTTWKSADDDFISFCKYMVNYHFYRLGVEISLITTVILISLRLDFYAVLYSFWLLGIFSLTRKQQARVWNAYIVFVVFVMILQYGIVVGVAPGFCVDYPWHSEDTVSKVQYWIFLPDPVHTPPAVKLLFDYILLAMICRQGLMFRIDSRFKDQDYSGGTNKNILKHQEEPGFVIPIHDFTSSLRNWLDVFFRVFFMAHMWLTLAIVFLAGTLRVNIFSVGYLLGSFYFLWQGTDMFLQPVKNIIRSWNCLLTFNVSMIVLKSALQLVGCLTDTRAEQTHCWAIQLFGIGCMDNYNSKIVYETGQCSVPIEDVGMAWDAACFAFLIFQRRICHSYYFFHVINETKAMTILSSRGAELKYILQNRKIAQQQKDERLLLESIKKKMERIKANQKKIRVPVMGYKNPKNNIEEGAPLARSNSMSSCSSVRSATPPAGYHTPIEEDDVAPTTPLTPRAGSFLQTQAPPTPSSAIMTVSISLDGYLDPQRISFSSPPASELIPRPPSSDESFPVFSPPPYGEAVGVASEVGGHQRKSSSGIGIGPSWLQDRGWLKTPRHSIISRALSHEELDGKVERQIYRRREPNSAIEAKRSGDYYMFEEFESIDYDFTSHSEKSRDEVLDEFHDEEAFKNRQKRKMTVSELLSSVVEKDIDSATRQQQRRSIKRRSSMPLHRYDSTVSYKSAKSHMSAPLPRDSTREHVRVVHPRETQYDELSDELQDASDGDTHQEEEKQRGIVYRILHNILRYLMFGWAFVESLMVSMTLYLNKYSKDYRYVRKVMAKDKIRIKSNPDFGIGTRSGRALVWAPKVVSKTAVDPNINKDNDEDDKLRGSGTTSPEEMYRKAVEEENRIERLNEATAIELQGITSDENQEEIELKERKSKDATYKGGAKRRPRKASMLNVPEIRILAPSLERGLDSEEPYPKESRHSSHTSLDDYDETTMDKDDQSPFVQLVLAMWFIVLSHSDIVCYFMIFLHQIKSATLLSLPLPLIVFGWGTLSVPRPSKTFWITIIAYTQVIVLIKCMFQFEFLPWNQNDFPDQSPFHPATFIGINKVQQYATYDLCLLLVVFFHRTMLMSLGLWKTTVAEDAEENDNYNMGMSKNELTNAEKLQSSSSSSSSSDSIDSVLLEDDGGGGDNGAGGDDGGGGDENTDGSSKKPRQRLVSASGLTVELDGSEKNFEERGSGDSNIVATRKERAGPCVQFPTVMIMSVKKYAESTRMFFEMLFNGKIKVSTNVYSIMFICDFFNFFVICFAFSSFSAGNTTILDYLSENKVPLTFLVMVIVQFFLMIIDRAIFLRKAIVCKLIFQYILIIGVHIWMFFVLPSITERAFNNRIAPQMWYVVKCIYLMVSAYQIRSGYPTKILGNFICQRYTLTRKLAFKGYMFIPFLYELRTVMDWIWTGTSMSLFDWLNMEDIFCTIFDLKCSRNFEEKSNSPRGTKKSPIVKAFLGGTFLFGIIGVLWFPLIFFAIGDSVGNPNLPTEIRVQLRLGASEPIFDITALGNDIKPFGQNELTEFTSAYRKHKSALYFLSDFVYQDIAAVILNSDSVHNWAISPPDRARLLDVLESKLKNETLKVTMIQMLMHKSNNKEHPDVITSKLDQNLDDNLKPELARMIKENVNSSIVVRNIFPKFVRVYNKGEITPVHQLMIKEIEDKSVNRNINLKLEKRNGLEWWNVQENCSDNLHTTILSNLPFVDCTKLVMYTFNDKIFDARLNWISGAGIIGAYVTIVFVIWRMGKDIFAGGVHKIPFEELPCVDRILQLCLDIYLVRESGDYYLEEELYAKLIFLFRSPETLIKWSRPIEEEEEEDDEEATVAAM